MAVNRFPLDPGEELSCPGAGGIVLESPEPLILPVALGRGEQPCVELCGEPILPEIVRLEPVGPAGFFFMRRMSLPPEDCETSCVISTCGRSSRYASA